MFDKKRLFILNFACILAYVFGAYVGRFFALPPSGASPIWPPAGIALSMLLLYRNGVLPGIFLGSLLAQTGSFFDGSSKEAIATSLFTGSFISIGVCLQAMFGRCLINRAIGEDNSLIKDAHVVKFLFSGGVVGCSIATLFGTSILFYIGVIGSEDILATWATWWIGDAIGVLVITPLMLIFLAQPRELWQKRRNYVVYPLLMLLGLIVIIFYYSKQQEMMRIKEIFNRQAMLVHDALHDELESHININLVLKSYFENSAFVDEKEFSQFSKTILAQHRSIEAIKWLPHVKAEQRTEFEDSLSDGIWEFSEKGHRVLARKRGQYFPQLYVEPSRENELFLGVDMAADPAVSEILFRLRDTGASSLVEQYLPIRNQSFERKMVVYSPVYDGLANSVENRRAALRGFVANVFSLAHEIEEISEEIPGLQLLLEIKNGEQLVYGNFPKNKSYEAEILHLYRQDSLKFANQNWQISYMPSQAFVNTHQTWIRWWLLFGCFLFVGLSGVALLMLSGRTLRTEELVKVRTQALRKEVAERENRSKVLQAIAASMPLKEVLDMIVTMTEADDPEILCSILLLDAKEKRLMHGAAGRLPEFYIKAVDGIEIGEDVGSCGTAAYVKQRVIVSDISLHPYWEKFADLAKQAGVAACWSEPIMSSEHQVLGTFAIYYRTPKSPGKAMLDKIESLSQLASLAIEKKYSEDKIRYLAFYDALTKLPNRRLLHDRLTQELLRAERHYNYGALMFLDLDHFKTLNDSLGHHVGDELLVQVADRLRSCVRDEDTIARLGGDEFVVLLRGKDLDSNVEQASAYAMSIAKRIQSELYIPYSLQGYEHVVTSSIGITLFSADNNDIENLFKQADTAMYAAKNKGRNAFSFYSSEMAQQADKRLQLESDLRAAINNDEFVLHYQAQHDAKGRIVGAEALLRWQHPEKGMVAVQDFMPACEESGLILAIGEWTLQRACRQLVNWPMLEHISLNVSSRQFHQPIFVEQIRNALSEYQLLPQTLMLEITEKIIVKDIQVSIEKLEALQKLGVRIAIDDFGMGYSSLADLRKLPIDQLKIDQSFIKDISSSKDAALIVEAMLMMARHLGLHVVAEGVENLAQMVFLQQNKCNVYQGYYFSRPVSSDEFSLLLAKDFNASLIKA